MSKYYYATYSDCLIDADVIKFEHWRELEDFLYEGIPADERLDYRITEAQFTDCWLKLSEKPRVGERDIYSPFTYNQLIIAPPGTHPGGRCYWVTPRPNIWVLERNDRHSTA